MKLIFSIVLLLFLFPAVLGQSVKMIHKGLESDSSFYHIVRIARLDILEICENRRLE